MGRKVNSRGEAVTKATMKATNKALAGLMLSMLVVACATAPATRPPEGLFHDHLFLAPSERISADDVFAMSAEMKHYLDTEIAGQIRHKGPQQGLFDALYAKRQLMLDYDATLTRNAARAFAARSGNCLSLVIMTVIDNFRRRDHSGWAKAGWTLLIIFLPLIGVLTYMIARPPEDRAMMA